MLKQTSETLTVVITAFVYGLFATQQKVDKWELFPLIDHAILPFTTNFYKV